MIQHNMYKTEAAGQRRTKPKVVRRYHYQGREIKATIQAPSLKTLNAMIGGMRIYARQHNLGAIKVLSRGRDPDGGYEAIVSAHNANPFRWVAKKWEGRGGGWEGRMAKSAVKEKHRFAQSKLKEARLRRKRGLLVEKELLTKQRTRVQLAKAQHEAAVVRKRKAYMARPRGYKVRKITSLGW